MRCSTILRGCRYLNLGGNILQTPGIQALAASIPTLTALQTLIVPNLPGAHADSIITSTVDLPELRTLDLSWIWHGERLSPARTLPTVRTLPSRLTELRWDGANGAMLGVLAAHATALRFPRLQSLSCAELRVTGYPDVDKLPPIGCVESCAATLRSLSLKGALLRYTLASKDALTLARLPVALAQCAHLTYLNLSQAKGWWPPQVSSARLGDSGNWDTCFLQVLPSAFSGLHHLRVLKLAHCHLGSSAATYQLIGALRHLARLEFLDLRGNTGLGLRHLQLLADSTALHACLRTVLWPRVDHEHVCSRKVVGPGAARIKAILGPCQDKACSEQPAGRRELDALKGMVEHLGNLQQSLSAVTGHAEVADVNVWAFET